MNRLHALSGKIPFDWFNLDLNAFKIFMSRVGVFVDDVCPCDVDVLLLGRSWFLKELRFLLL